MNEVYGQLVGRPYPNLATIAVAGLIAPGSVVEIVGYAHFRRR